MQVDSESSYALFEMKIIINTCFGNRSDEGDEEEEVLLGDGEALDNEPVLN